MQTQLYTEDWIGLRALDEAGKVKFVRVPGNHLGISKSDMQGYVVPYLKQCDFQRIEGAPLRRMVKIKQQVEQPQPKAKVWPDYCIIQWVCVKKTTADIMMDCKHQAISFRCIINWKNNNNKRIYWLQNWVLEKTWMMMVVRSKAHWCVGWVIDKIRIPRYQLFIFNNPVIILFFKKFIINYDELRLGNNTCRDYVCRSVPSKS